MRRLVFLIMIFAAAVSRAQVAPSATGGTPDTQMETPPPVSGANYPTAVGAGARSNYLRGGVSYTTSYIDNLYAGSASASIAETTFSILPRISFDATTARQHAIMTYSAGFTIYRPSSTLNEVDNSVMADYGLRLTPHTMVRAIDALQSGSSPFFPTGAEAGGVVSGAPVSSTPGVVPPFAKRLMNSANAGITAQIALNDMIGASGLSTVLHYPNSSETPGLYNSSSRGGSAFYSHRISPSQYFGVTYQYLDMLTFPTGGESTTTTSTLMGYYTIYFDNRLSISVSGGPQHYELTGALLPTLNSWATSVSASMGWQGERTGFAASYSQSVTGGGGLLGAYRTKAANMSGNWRLARTWTTGVSGTYSIINAIDAISSAGDQNGHTLSGSVTLEHPIGSQVSLAFHYDRIHQGYEGIAAIAANPDSDRESISITWNFQRPLGR